MLAVGELEEGGEWQKKLKVEPCTLGPVELCVTGGGARMEVVV